MSKFKEINGNFDVEIPLFGIKMKGDLHAIRESVFNSDKEIDGSESNKEALIEKEKFDPDKEIDGSESNKEALIEKEEFDPDKEIDGSESNKDVLIEKEEFDPDKEIDGSESNKEALIKEEEFDPDKEIDGSESNKEALIEEEEFDPDKEITSSKQEESIEYVKCLNEKLEGKCHEETGVPFEKRVIELEDKKIEGVFPKFQSVFEAQLPKEMLIDKDKVQFKECNVQLRNALENNTELYEKFTEEQREQIKNLDTPDGYVWHHDAEVGKLQLVDFEVHSKTSHTGGRFIWGGGSACRR